MDPDNIDLVHSARIKILEWSDGVINSPGNVGAPREDDIYVRTGKSVSPWTAFYFRQYSSTNKWRYHPDASWENFIW